MPKAGGEGEQGDQSDAAGHASMKPVRSRRVDARAISALNVVAIDMASKPCGSTNKMYAASTR